MFVFYAILLLNWFSWLWTNSCENCAPSQYQSEYIDTTGLLTLSPLAWFTYGLICVVSFLYIHRYILSTVHKAPYGNWHYEDLPSARDNTGFLCYAVRSFFRWVKCKTSRLPPTALKAEVILPYYHTMILKAWKLVFSARSRVLVRPWNH